MTGVWLHNDGNNAGYAQLVNQVPSAIAGVHKETSWLMYSRVWTADQESHVEEAIKKIQQDHPNPSGDLPFGTLKSILNSSHNTVNTPYEASSVVAKIPEDSQKREVGPNGIMFNVLEADLADLDEQYEEDEGGITQTQIAAEVSNEEDALSNEEDTPEDAPDSLPHIKESPPAKIRLKIRAINNWSTTSNPLTQPFVPPLDVPTGRAELPSSCPVGAFKLLLDSCDFQTEPVALTLSLPLGPINQRPVKKAKTIHKPNELPTDLQQTLDVASQPAPQPPSVVDVAPPNPVRRSSRNKG
ncbi:hypothetical protein PSTG_02427 [Puccinia striiformis f. sp. tritici PST-78]|uniref:Uncharacterized protein n=1 Tax=Puccinia striiformis f. sp. tritici PST-78 TaxID=1165861 RepID=A0A0L0VZ94_9BASI|nr:hypothetical protein PSTG_02427 [Puccinia striiformis f. sp. tritici PST-78]